MLHYNYSAPLSFLSSFGGEDSSAVSRDVEDGNSREDLSTRYMSPGGAATPGAQASKSFTIAAILGLKNDPTEKPTDLTVVNLSVHQGVADRLGDCRSCRLPGGLAAVRPNVYQRPLGATNLGRTHKQKPGLSSNHGAMGPSSGGGKSKRVRTIFTPEQLERLEAEFERQQYMVGPERLYLAHTLQLTEAQVKVWFQNRRIKWRKHHLEVTQQRLAAIKQRHFIAAATGVPSSPPLQQDIMEADDSSSETDS